MSLLAAALALAAPAAAEAPYGTLADGRAVSQVTLTNDWGMAVKLIGYGAIVTDIVVPDAAGRPENVALGFATLADYEAKNANYDFGAVVGRYAGRIAGARFSIDGTEYSLGANDPPNALHGGPGGTDMALWSVEPFTRGAVAGAVLRHSSPAGDQGFPGRLDATVTYSLTPDNALRIDYEATTDAPTHLNLTNHSYVNLAGAGEGTIRDHRLQILSGALIDTTAKGIPTGEALEVAKTPFDFRAPRRIGEAMDWPHRLLEGSRGFNHGWMLSGEGLRTAAILSDPASGRVMEVLTTEPSLHVYAANWFGGDDLGAQGIAYPPHAGIALEAQAFPDAPNRPEFPSTLLRPGETFRSTTIYRFSAVPEGTP